MRESGKIRFGDLSGDGAGAALLRHDGDQLRQRGAAPRPRLRGARACAVEVWHFPSARALSTPRERVSAWRSRRDVFARPAFVYKERTCVVAQAVFTDVLARYHRLAGTETRFPTPSQRRATICNSLPSVFESGFETGVWARGWHFSSVVSGRPQDTCSSALERWIVQIQT